MNKLLFSQGKQRTQTDHSIKKLIGTTTQRRSCAGGVWLNPKYCGYLTTN